MCSNRTVPMADGMRLPNGQSGIDPAVAWVPTTLMVGLRLRAVRILGKMVAASVAAPTRPVFLRKDRRFISTAYYYLTLTQSAEDAD
ncbi:MAG: hypothetical protein ACL93V_14205 [Candidatus Electrothrix sp. YB6]